MRRRHVLLALEAGELGPEGGHEASIQLQQAIRGQAGAFVGPGGQCLGNDFQVAGEGAEHVLHEEGVGVVDDLLAGTQLAQPDRRELVVRCQVAHVLC